MVRLRFIFSDSLQVGGYLHVDAGEGMIREALTAAELAHRLPTESFAGIVCGQLISPLSVFMNSLTFESLFCNDSCRVYLPNSQPAALLQPPLDSLPTAPRKR